MRTGAIFARGSCRALKWMALAGVVFALGAVDAVAQGTLTISSNMENSAADVTLTLTAAAEADRAFTLELGTIDDPSTAIDESRGPHVAENQDRVLVVSTLTVEKGKTVGTVERAIDFRPDPDAEDDHFSLTATEGADTITGYFMIDDDDEQYYRLTLPTEAGNAITEDDGPVTLALEADPARSVDIPVALELTASVPANYRLGDLSEATFGSSGRETVTASIEALPDGDRANDTITVTAYTGTLAAREKLGSRTINVKDANILPDITLFATAPGSDDHLSQVTEGEDYRVWVRVSEEATENLTVELKPEGATGEDFSLADSTLEIGSGSMLSEPVRLEIHKDDDLGGEDLIFSAVVRGEAKNGNGTRDAGQAMTLHILDATMRLVRARDRLEIESALHAAKDKEGGGDNPGENFSILGSALFSIAPGYEATYSGRFIER